jgi:PPOX class probable F420-dependent enzyme
VPLLSPEVEAFLKEPHLAALASIRPNGRPHVTPVWFEFDGREFTISTFRETQKAKNIAKKGFAALSVYSTEMPYRQVTVEGTARIGGPIDNVWRERVAMRYLGEAAGRAYVRESMDLDAIAIHIRPIKWHLEGFGLGQESET